MKLFSERYNYTKASDVIIREKITPEIQNAICSCYDRLRDKIFFRSGFYDGQPYIDMDKYLWTFFLNLREGDFQDGRMYHIVATNFLEDKNNSWYRKLDIVEFTIKYLHKLGEDDCRYSSIPDEFIKQLNSEFERLNFAYRVVGTEIVEITSKEELAAVESAMNDSATNIKLHLNKALELYAQRPIGDYRNSIKESISAVEAYCREIAGKKNLGDALDTMIEKGVIPKMLKVAFEKLYAYTNQPDTGIRHALMDDDGTYTPASEEALFMLVSCSSFINYLNKKLK
ncbi:MAG: hypothetical protein IKO46_06725 [Salinivirgaceae bacterium]|nr:hypothetical protein [Salinivirgaceae bacterium]